MRLSATKLGSIANSRSFGDQLFDLAGEVPNLDLNFAGTKTLDPRVTFTRASTGTFVGSDGVLQSAVTNLLLRSEEFDNAYWTKARATVTANAAISPTGVLTADALIEDSTASNTHLAFSSSVSVATGTIYTYSIYAKATGRSWFNMQIGTGLEAYGATVPFCFFNVSNGTTGTSANCTPTIQSVGDGWYRCILTAIATTAATTTNIRIKLADSSSSDSYTGNGTSGIFIWGAQLEQSSTVGEYIPTTSTINSAPRFDHNPTTGESLGLLVEEARTNGIRNNTMVGAVAGTPGTNPNLWAYVTAQSNGLTVSVVGTGTESGINYIDYRFNGTTVASPLGVAFGIDTATAATGQTWTNSLYWKLAAGTTTGVSVWQIGVIENTSGGAFVSGANYVQTAPTTASLITQRPLATRTLSGGATVGQVVHTVSFTVTGNTTMDFTLRLGMPQMEQGAFATSVIPTTTATATRAADVASITGSNFSSFYNQTEGTVFADAISVATNTNVFSISDNSTNNRIQLETGSNTRRFRITSSGSARYDNSVSYTFGTQGKTVGAYLATSTNHATNGTLGSTSTASPLPVVDRIYIGSNAAGSLPNNGTIKRLTYWPTRFTNPTLQAISQP